MKQLQRSERPNEELTPQFLDPAHGWWPYANLIYLFFVFLPLFFVPDVPSTAWIASGVAVAFFLPVYFAGWRYQSLRVPALLLTAALGFALVPFNPGGNSFLIYAIAHAGYFFVWRRALAISVVLVVLLGLQMAILGQSLAYVAITGVIGGMVLVGNFVSRAQARHNAELRVSQEEVQRLARANERERIARDLHDLLGHTLSVIAVKAELARRLCQRGDPLAVAEMAEVERVARDALSEVRHAVADMRGASFHQACDNACSVLEGTGLHVERDTPAIAVGPEADQVLAWVLREAVTNVMRHSQATRVRIALGRSAGTIVLEVHDNGCGTGIVEGQGLSGMRERIAQIGGELEIESGDGGGTRLRACVPDAATGSYPAATSADTNAGALIPPGTRSRTVA